MDLKITPLAGTTAAERDVEIVERKGLGHPDTICDIMAENLSLALCRFYRKRFGAILHHNVDKVLLCAGEAEPRFHGGEILQPLELIFAGRATLEHRGIAVPIQDLARQVAEDWFHTHFPGFNASRDLRVRIQIRHGSQELTELFMRQASQQRWLANDTSCGVGFAPLTPLERLILEVEMRLTDPTRRQLHPERGPDVKIMGIREGGKAVLTVACAFVGRYVQDLDDYLAKKEQLAIEVADYARRVPDLATEVSVNTADEPDAGSVYLTVSGTSAEAGDDGEAGRGNRCNGLITPGRPMTMESVAGKNPITHVGKLYNATAALIASRLAQELPELKDTHCLLVSQIGRDVTDPQLASIEVAGADAAGCSALAGPIKAIVRSELEAIPRFAEEWLAGRIAFDRWPLRASSPANPLPA